MLSFPTTRKQFVRGRAALLLLAATAWYTVSAHASTLTISTDCSASGDTFKCHLHQFLHLLYAAATFLGIALAVVIVLAYKSLRKSRKDPEDQV